VVSNRRNGARTGDAQVHSITSAAAPLGDDIDRRARRYLFQMTLRTLCFLGAVFTWGRVPTAISVALLVGAVVLPYIAVVLANAGRERPERPEPLSPVRELGGAPVPGSGYVPGAPFPGSTSAYEPGSVYEPTSVYEPSTFPVVDPFGPGAERTSTRPAPDRSGRDGADENGAPRG
jgi:hypothetical protein